MSICVTLLELPDSVTFNSLTSRFVLENQVIKFTTAHIATCTRTEYQNELEGMEGQDIILVSLVQLTIFHLVWCFDELYQSIYKQVNCLLCETTNSD